MQLMTQRCDVNHTKLRFTFVELYEPKSIVLEIKLRRVLFYYATGYSRCIVVTALLWCGSVRDIIFTD
jgi:hypothetical protein